MKSLFYSAFYGAATGAIIGLIESICFRLTVYKNFPPLNTMSFELIIPGIFIITILNGIIIGMFLGCISYKWPKLYRIIFVISLTSILLWVIMIPLGLLNQTEDIFSKVVG